MRYKYLLVFSVLLPFATIWGMAYAYHLLEVGHWATVPIFITGCGLITAGLIGAALCLD